MVNNKLNNLLVEVNKTFLNKSEFVLESAGGTEFLFRKSLNVKVDLDEEDWFRIYENGEEIVSFYDIDDTSLHLMLMS